MHPSRSRFSALFALVAGLWIFLMLGMAQANQPQQASTDQEDLLARGEYLANVANCYSCHTPFTEDYADPTASNLSPEELVAFSLNEHVGLDDERPFAGGRAFNLGPIGILYGSNLTPDPETGLGNWTDEEIKNAIRLGLTPEGRQMHPIMPYFTFNKMAEADLDALVAYLRSLEPIENDVQESALEIPPFGLTVPEEPIVAPDPADTAQRGRYLLTGVIACTDCHTPLDPATGAPNLELYFAGGQPYEGPWGVIYAANLTPDEATGLGNWNDEEIARALRQGVRIDGRRLVLMPWADYTRLTDDDLAAVIHFLRNDVVAVENQVPAPSLTEGFSQSAN
jgi:mono/diheme cytochrome c family protein